MVTAHVKAGSGGKGIQRDRVKEALGKKKTAIKTIREKQVKKKKSGEAFLKKRPVRGNGDK